MGTETERPTLTWAMRGPDRDGFCWIDVDGFGEMNSYNLGTFDDVGDKLCAWLAANDFGERPPAIVPDAGHR